MGDFNLPNADFVNCYTTCGDESFEYKFLNKTQDMYLCQHVNMPTRTVEGQAENILDLIFTDGENMVTDLEPIAPLGKKDHVGLTWSLAKHLDPGKRDDLQNSLNYWKGNYIYNYKDIEESWKYFSNITDNICTKHIPIKQTKKKKRLPEWMTNQLCKSVKKKYELHKKYQKLGRMKDYYDYKKQRNLA